MKVKDQSTQRIHDVRAKFAEWDVDAILVGSSKNRRWLTGFRGSSGWALLSKDVAVLGTDFRYWEEVKAQTQAFELVKFTGGFLADLRMLLDAANCERIGLEANHLTLSQYEKIKQILDKDFVQIVDGIETLRQQKSEEELRLIKQAASITDRVMSGVDSWLRPGLTEKEVAWQLEMNIHDAGGAGLAFPIIVATGSNSAHPHHEPGDSKLVSGDVVIIDMGAEVDGYCSDLTRTFYLDQNPSDRFWEIYNLVSCAQKNAIEHLNCRLSPKEIDELARNIIENGGYGKEFGHGLGHGVGLDIHEPPLLSRNGPSEAIGSEIVVTLEPAIYCLGWGGIRIEDLVLIGDMGVELLSQCPKNPVIQN